LKALRNSRWDTAFHPSIQDDDPRDTINRKATIVIEHLIQASDVSYNYAACKLGLSSLKRVRSFMLQLIMLRLYLQWHIYRKWNERFFFECYKAYSKGRGSDPSLVWYQGEMGYVL
jgi:hypothetical protein